jgi:hypothetical protein
VIRIKICHQYCASVFFQGQNIILSNVLASASLKGVLLTRLFDTFKPRSLRLNTTDNEQMRTDFLDSITNVWKEKAI